MKWSDMAHSLYRFFSPLIPASTTCDRWSNPTGVGGRRQFFQCPKSVYAVDALDFQASSYLIYWKRYIMRLSQKKRHVIFDRSTKDIAKRLMEIGRQCVVAAPEEWQKRDFDAELYNEAGLPAAAAKGSEDRPEGRSH